MKEMKCKRSFSFLAILDDRDVEWFLEVGRKRRIEQGTMLIQQGIRCDSVFFVLDGGFRVAVHGKEVALLGAGEVLGEMSFIDSCPPSASVFATRGSSVLAVPVRDLAEKLAEDTNFALRFYKALAFFLSHRLRETTSRMGHGEGLSLDENVEDQDELSVDLLDSVSLAGARFTTMQERARAAAV